MHDVHFSLSVDCYICGTITALEAACEDPFNPEGMFKFACRGSCAKYKGEKGDIQGMYVGLFQYNYAIENNN